MRAPGRAALAIGALALSVAWSVSTLAESPDSGPSGHGGYAIHIVSPRPGEKVTTPEMLVRGTVRAPRGAGAIVMVQGALPDELAKGLRAAEGAHGNERLAVLGMLGILAVIEEGQFAARTAIRPGTNTIRATVGPLDGERAQDAVTVEAMTGADHSPSLHATPPVGPAPLTVKFLSTSLPRLGVQLDLDFEGDGVIDGSAATLESVSHIYAKPGLFFPTVTVRSPEGAARSASGIVDVFAPPTDLVHKWNAMKAALRRGDVDAALEFIRIDSRQRYREMFTHLTVNLAQIDEVLSDIKPVRIDQMGAEFEMLRVEDGKTYSYFVLFVRDYDGIWRVKSF